VIRVENLSCRLNGAAVLEDVSLEVREGEKVALLGANGAGKSTLLWCIAGLLRFRGRVEKRGRLAMVFQNPEDQLFMPALLEDLTLPLVNAGMNPAEAESRARSALKQLGLEERASEPASRLSLGLRKRAAIALALAQEPAALLLDEPTSELDGASVRRLKDAVRRLECACLIATHDLEFARAAAARAVVLERGRVAASGVTETLLSDRAFLERCELV
jgi:cobalt/nickel transport system ATP-binding protein